MISFLKKEDEDGNPTGSKFMGKGDIIFLIVLASIIFGVWYYHKYTKEKTESHYATCEALFVEEKLSEAKECYENAVNLPPTKIVPFM